MSSAEIRIPDIGDFADVPVIEIHVSAGSVVAVDDPLVTLESDKATLDVPAPVAGTVSEVRINIGDRVSQGELVAILEAEGQPGVPPKERVHESGHPAPQAGADYGSASGVYDRIEVTVPDNSTTTFYGKATGTYGFSTCSSAGPTYAEVTPAPSGSPGVNPGVIPGPTGQRAAALKKCSKVKSKAKKKKCKRRARRLPV